MMSLLRDRNVFTNFYEDVKLFIEFWIPILSLSFKAFISVMKSPVYLPNVDLWISYCWWDVFIEIQLCVRRFWQWFQINHWILNIHFVISIQIIYTSDEVADRVTKFLPLFSCVFWRCLYWIISCSKSCLSLHFILFYVIIMMIFSQNYCIICYALN